MESLIVLKQLPVIEDRLYDLKTYWAQMAKDANDMVCTEETIQSVKSYRAQMRKQFESVDSLRKEIKAQALAPWYSFEETFKDCVTEAYNEAESTFKIKISSIESEQKKRCEDGLRDYFSELCAVHHIDWLQYEQSGIKVDMASAKAKTPKKLREQLVSFVTQVSENVDRISSMEYADEIMVEFRKSLDIGSAIYTVQEWHRKIEEEHTAQEARKATREQEETMVRRVEALAPPVTVAATPETVKCTFTIHATMEQLKKLKEFMNMEGIQYE